MIVVMIFSSREGRYIPILWILVTGKTLRCYAECISWVARCLPSGQCPQVTYSGIDFEAAFLEALTTFFPDAKKIGCNFHLKQANREKLIKLGFDPAVVDAILSTLDTAIVLPSDEIIRKGVPFLQKLARKALKERKYQMSEDDERLWDSYWDDYFVV